MFNLIKKLIINLKSIIWPLAAIILYLISRSFDSNSWVVERVYSRVLNKWFIQILSFITGLVSFSISELLILSHIVAIPVVVVILVKEFNKGKFLTFSKKILSYLSILYIIFMFMWGFNYNREPFAETTNLEVKASSTDELYNLTKALTLEANELRNQVKEDSNGVMMVEGGYQSIFERSYKGYEAASVEYSLLRGKYGRPKPIKLSGPMLHTRIVGIYIPFTAEANINIATPDLQIPTNTLHELAHQRGFAYEGEANYIAYLTATAHPDVDFRYSGTVFALRYSINALLRDDYERGSEILELFSEGLKRDLSHNREFWSQYEGKTSEVADQVNDTYLKGNGQEEGTKSYGQVVDLLLAHYRKYGSI